MKARVRDTAAAPTSVCTAVALSLVLSLALAACGTGAGGDSGGAGGPRIGVLLPDATTARWEAQDRPLLEKRIKELCATCAVEHANAKGDVALQQEQMDSMITKGVDAIVLVAVDARSLGTAVAKAHAADIPVIAYDRLAEGPISGYVSFDGVEVGRLQGRALLTAMGDKVPGAQIVMMNGDPNDPNAKAFKEGALSVLDGKVRIGKAYDTPQWRAETAHMNMSGALAALGADAVDGVYAANDGLAGGSIAALKADKVAPLPPVTGQDAELAALRRIVAGEQYMTVFKPFGPEAAAGGAMAVAAARGQSLGKVATSRVPTRGGEPVASVLLTPVPVTAGTIRDTVVKDGLHTVAQICVPQLRAACARAGLT